MQPSDWSRARQKLAELPGQTLGTTNIYTTTCTSINIIIMLTYRVVRLYVYRQKAWYHLKAEASRFSMIPWVAFQGHASWSTIVLKLWCRNAVGSLLNRCYSGPFFFERIVNGQAYLQMINHKVVPQNEIHFQRG